MGFINPPSKAASWDDLREEVKANGGIRSYSMGQLRDLSGWKKLGSTVRQEIAKELAGHGLKHWPATLPDYQEQQVRLYVTGSDADDLISAVLDPSPGPGSDARILSRLGGTDAEEVLARIRALVEVR